MAAEPASPLPLTRDPKDDYLLTYALAGQADYLVTGDADLLVLGQVGTVRIVSPADFAALLATDAEAD
jgi:predicted nucleic acid-binding protein